MIREAMQYLRDMRDVEVLEIEGKKYTNKLVEPTLEPVRERLNISTLAGLVDYMSENIDGVDIKGTMIHVAGPTEVFVLGPIMGPFKQREEIIFVRRNTCKDFSFGHYMDIESFKIGLLANFEQYGHRDEVIKYISSLTSASVVTTDDDGITQAVTARVGVARMGELKLPNPVYLRPHRTFPEVEQPASEFVFRLKTDEDRHGDKEIYAGLFEADNEAWKLQACENIKEWLQERLPGALVFV